MAAPQAWSSHIWTEQTLTRLIGIDQQQVEIRTNERMPQSFMVPRSLLHHYCPKLQPSSLPGQPFIFETNRPALTLFFGWLYTGKLDSADWHNLTELYFLGSSAGCVALTRSAISQLQKACRNDQANDTDLFHYEHISVIEDMVGASSSLFRYAEDTYFNHWRPSDDDSVKDDPSKHPNSSLFFKRLFERSFREQREGENCSCCHDYCRYHDHDSVAEQLATCGRSSVAIAESPTNHAMAVVAADPLIDAPVAVVNAFAKSSVNTPVAIAKLEPAMRKVRKSRSSLRRESMNSALVTSIDDFSSHETRAASSRSGTPKGKAADDTWLTVQSRAPVNFPDDYHGLLTSLPQVQSIKPPNWLEIGVEAEGIDQLPEPDRIIAAAMSWNAEDYAQTKCTFFNQYDPAMRDRNHWRNTLKFGGSKSKERAGRLLAMWESLGWLKDPEATASNAPEHSRLSVAPKPQKRASFGPKKAWSADEADAVAKIMSDINKSSANSGVVERARMCSERLASQHGYSRTESAILSHLKKTQVDIEAEAQTDRGTQADQDVSKRDTQVAQHIQPYQDTKIEGDVRAEPTDGEDEDLAGVRGKAWSSQEDEAMLEIMDNLEKHPAHKYASMKRRAEMCQLRLKTLFGFDRSPVAVNIRYRRVRHNKEAGQTDDNTDTSANDSVIDEVNPAIVKIPLASDSVGKFPLIGHPVFKEFTPINNAVRGRWESLNSSSDASNSTTKRKGEDIGGASDFGPLADRKKRRHTDRFVAELYDDGKE